MDGDMDLDDDFMAGPAQAPTRRFVPKGAKTKPKPKIEKLPPKKEEIAPTTLDQDHHPFDVKDEVKKEEIDDVMETEDERVVPVEEDVVVREIDVYLNQSVEQDTLLYVLHYPLRPVWRPYELDERCEEVRLKPKTNEMQIDLALDVHSRNYYPRAGNGEHMEKQTIETSWVPPLTSGSTVAVGLLEGNQLHLNPVHAVVQLRPSMQHLESKESRRKTNAAKDGKKKVKVEDLPEGSSLKASKKASTPTVEAKDSGEDWIPLRYHGGRSDKASRYLHNMVAGERLPINFPMSSNEYLDNLCPGTPIAGSRSRDPPRKSLLILPFEERLKTWLCKGPPIQRFDCLKYLAPEEPVEEVLDVLVKHARLVQGLWVPKTSLVVDCEKGIESMARDRVLLLFSKDVFISHSQLPREPKLVSAMRVFLNVFAVERPAFSNWKLKETPDLKFNKLYPSVVRQQEEQWSHIEKRLPKSNTRSHTAQSRTSSQVDKRTATAEGSNRAMPKEAREAILRALPKFFKMVKVCSSQHMGRLLREVALSEHQRPTTFAKEAEAAADNIDAFPDDFQTIISQVAVNIHGVWVPKSSPDNPKLDPIREVILDLYRAEGPTAKLKRATILEAAKVKLGNEVPLADLKKMLSEICKSQGTDWVLKPGDGSPNH